MQYCGTAAANKEDCPTFADGTLLFHRHKNDFTMSVHKLVKQQQIAAPLPEVWRFFSDARNLQHLTPPYMRMRITSGDLPDEIYPGMIITYKVSPVAGIPLFWMTEITHAEKEKFFVDEQRQGPYSLWHHQHHFQENEKGVLMTDIVHYRLPLGLLGDMAHALFVRRQLNEIFEFRVRSVDALFGNRQ